MRHNQATQTEFYSRRPGGNHLESLKPAVDALFEEGFAEGNGLLQDGLKGAPRTSGGRQGGGREGGNSKRVSGEEAWEGLPCLRNLNGVQPSFSRGRFRLGAFALNLRGASIVLPLLPHAASSTPPHQRPVGGEGFRPLLLLLCLRSILPSTQSPLCIQQGPPEAPLRLLACSLKRVFHLRRPWSLPGSPQVGLPPSSVVSCHRPPFIGQTASPHLACLQEAAQKPPPWPGFR